MAFTYVLHKDSELTKNAASIVVSSSSADINYPAENASRLPLAQPWRSAGVSSEWWQVDLGASKTIDFIAVAGLNLTDTPATFEFKSGDSDPPTTNTHVMPAAIGGTSWLALGTSVSARYWRLDLVDGSNPDGYLDVGYVLLGLKTEWTHGFGPNFIEEHRQRNRRTENQFGTDFSGELLVDVVAIRFDFGGDGALNGSERDELEMFFAKLSGSQQPVFFVPEAEDAATRGYLGRFDNPEGWLVERLRKPFSRIADVVFKEENRGLPLPSN